MAVDFYKRKVCLLVLTANTFFTAKNAYTVSINVCVSRICGKYRFCSATAESSKNQYCPIKGDILKQLPLVFSVKWWFPYSPLTAEIIDEFITLESWNGWPCTYKTASSGRAGDGTGRGRGWNYAFLGRWDENHSIGKDKCIISSPSPVQTVQRGWHHYFITWAKDRYNYFFT